MKSEPLTVEGLIKVLQLVPEDRKRMPVYVAMMMRQGSGKIESAPIVHCFFCTGQAFDQFGVAEPGAEKGLFFFLPNMHAMTSVQLFGQPFPLQ